MTPLSLLKAEYKVATGQAFTNPNCQYPIIHAMFNYWTNNELNAPRISKCAKYYIFSTSFVFWTASAVACCLSAWQLITYIGDYKSFKVALLDPFFGLLLLCAIILFLSTFACTGSLRERPCCLRFFCFVIFLFILCQLVAIGILIVCRHSESFCSWLPWQPLIISVANSSTIRAAVFSSDDNDSRRLANLLEWVQHALGCCGLVKYRDWWLANSLYSCDLANPLPTRCGVPASCCRPKFLNDTVRCGRGVGMATPAAGRKDATVKIYTDGCVATIGNWLLSNAWFVVIAMVACLVIQLLACCLARSLAGQLDKKRRFERRQREQRRVGRTPAGAGGYTEYYTLI